MNLRNCSGKINRLYKSYNAKVSEDLDQIIRHIHTKCAYLDISICGFILGGNIVLKYPGKDRALPVEIKSAVSISVPCDLYDSLSGINTPKNYIYQQRFIKHLKKNYMIAKFISLMF